MTDGKLTPHRAKILADLEYILGDWCYNGSIENHGAGGVRQQAGRSFRYPLAIVHEDGSKTKVRSKASNYMPEELLTGHYAFGANKLQVIRGLNEILSYLEKNHGLKI